MLACIRVCLRTPSSDRDRARTSLAKRRRRRCIQWLYCKEAPRSEAQPQPVESRWGFQTDPSTTALQIGWTPPRAAQIDARVSYSRAARFGVRSPRNGISAPVVVDLALDFGQPAATFGARLTPVELDLHGATDLLECD